MDLGKRSYSRFNQFQHNVARGKEHDWKCRAGSRYLYICENGLVHWCSQQRGYPGIPLGEYTAEMRRREFHTHKGCAPMCTVSCVQQVGMLDNWRGAQTLQPGRWKPPRAIWSRLRNKISSQDNRQLNRKQGAQITGALFSFRELLVVNKSPCMR